MLVIVMHNECNGGDRWNIGELLIVAVMKVYRGGGGGGGNSVNKDGSKGGYWLW